MVPSVAYDGLESECLVEPKKTLHGCYSHRKVVEKTAAIIEQLGDRLFVSTTICVFRVSLGNRICCLI